MNLSASPELLAYLEPLSTEHIENIITNREWIEEGENPNYRPAGYTPEQIESVMADYPSTRGAFDTDDTDLFGLIFNDIRAMLVKRFWQEGCKCVAYETNEEFNFFWQIWRDHQALERAYAPECRSGKELPDLYYE